MQNTVGIDIKCHFNLRNPAWCWCNPSKFKHSQTLIRVCDFTLSLEDLDLHCRLIVISCCEDFRAFCRDCCVLFNELCHYSALCFNTKREWCDVKKKDVFNIALQNTSLQSCANCNNLIRVYALIRFFSTSKFANEIDNCWHTG